jgi:hypothetical protein
MGYDSQQGNLAGATELNGVLLHEIFTDRVKPNVWASSASRTLFQNAGAGDYVLTGEKLVGASELVYAGGALATDGQLPDHMQIEPVRWETTAKRLYVRRAIDRFWRARGSGAGSFENLEDRIFDQMWDTFERMEIRHAVGSSDGVVCLVDSRTSSTVVVVKDGYGHTGCPPLMHLEPGMVIAWVDADDGIDGAATISSINYSTKTITVDSAATWEPGDTTATGDRIVFATTPNISTDYFKAEFEAAPQGLMNMIDPDATFSTVQGIAEGTYPRWKPYRAASSTFDHIEVTEFLQKMRAKSTSPVNPSTHTAVSAGGPIAELARTLVGFQQQQNLGKTLEGGYQTIRIAGMDFLQDDFQLQDVIQFVCMEDIFAADLDGGADYAADDGSQFSRLSDFDALEWYVAHYKQNFCDRRNRFGALTGISLANVSADDYDPSPNY